MSQRFALAALAAALSLGAAAPLAFAQGKPIRIGVTTPIQLQVGRDTQDSVKMAIDEVNAMGGVLGRKLEMLVVDDRNGTLVVQPGWARFRLWPQVGAARRQRRHVGRDLGDPSRPIRRV